MDADEWPWMRGALELAERGRGFVEPNPLVGAVVVRDGRVVGEGWHRRYGEAHAEANALAVAGGAARGATLYVTLEPCCHHGKTPPCTEAVIRAGVRRVVAALIDPFPQVAGAGIATLKQAGLEVDVGLGAEQARRQNAPFLKLVTTGRPYVHAKWAMTLDGKIATRTGDSKWISNRAAWYRVHTLRGRMDAILVGVGTALADDPSLTARPPGPRTPCRIVLDSRGRLPPTGRLAQTAREVPVLLATAGEVPAERADVLRSLGVELVPVSPPGGRTDVPALLDELGRRRMTNVLVEGGAEVLGSFLDARAVNEVHVFVAPKLAGGASALTPVGGAGVEKIAEALAVVDWEVDAADGDCYLHGRVGSPADPP